MTTIQQKQKRNKKYWQDRALRLEAEKEALSDVLMERTRKSYVRSFNRLTGEINALYAEILDRGGIEEITRTELYRLRHYQALREKISAELKELAINDSKNLAALLNDVADKTYKENLEEFGIEYNIVQQQQAKAIATQNWTGVKFSDRIWGNSESLNSRIMSDIETLIISGKNPDELKKALMQDYSVGFREADRLIRTEASHAYNSAAIESYKEAGLAYIEYLAEADCCELCEPYSGERFLIADAPTIPVHPNCRCTYLPVVE